MRVAILLNTNIGGRWSVPAAAAMVARGDDVMAILATEDGDLGDLYAKAGATVRHHAFDKEGLGNVPASWRAIRSELERFKPDVIVYYLYKAAMFGRTIGATLGVPTVHVIVGPVFLEAKLTRTVERIATRFDTVIGAGSEAIHRSLQSIGGPPTSVIYPPCDLERFQPPTSEARAAARDELGIDQNAFVTVLVAYWYASRPLQGAMQHSKGHDVALKAWVSAERKPEDRLLIVGGGFRDEGRRYREQFLRDHADLIDDSVIVVDTVPDSAPYYRAADVSIAPSTTENLGSAAEASAMGVPSIASRTGGFPEIVIPGYSGWLADVGDVDGFRRAISDAMEAKRDGRLRVYAERARALTEAMFPVDLVAQQMCDLVDRAVRIHRSRR